jgi:N-methylhydantoinase A
MRRATARLAVDIGGTFTDVVVERPDGTLVVHKRLTTPDDPARGFAHGVAQALRMASVDGADVAEVHHATTLGSNVVIERRGVPVVLITTRGFRDVLEIQRALRHSMYDVQIKKPEPLVPRSRIWTVTERCLADGSVRTPLVEAEVTALAQQLRTQGISSVAVAYLHAYANPGHERRTRDLLQSWMPELLVTLSSDVSLQAREYERVNTAVVNAYLLPVLRDYLTRLDRELRTLGVTAPIWIMQSSGGLTSAERAADMPVRTIESGPAAGVLMAAHHGRLTGHANVISFDMGGTTAKASVIRDGRPTLSRRFELDRVDMRDGSGLPIDVPAVDLIEVGAGGGSIAHVQTGVLHVGPRSAGSVPGPACYGRGGQEATVTDADLLLGYLNPDYFAGGSFALDVAAAESAVERVGAQLGLDRLRTAWGIHEVVTLNMERAIRLISIDRGLDPRDFVMTCFGGAGPVHGCRLARALGIRRVLVPHAAGVGSGVGLLQAERSIELARTMIFRLDEPEADTRVAEIFGSLESQARQIVAAIWDSDQAVIHRSAGLRYAGQGHELEVSLDRDPPSVAALTRAFANTYRRTYGYEDQLSVEGVNWYVSVSRYEKRSPAPPSVPLVRPSAVPERKRLAYYGETGLVTVPVYHRQALRPGDHVTGPALIEERDTTTVLLPGDEAAVHPDLALRIDIGERT